MRFSSIITLGLLTTSIYTVSYSYYVEINHGLPKEPEITSTKDAKPKPTKDSKPSPTQDSLIDTCTSFYQAAKGDTYTKIIAKYKTFDFNDFFKTPTSPPSQTTATEIAVETSPSKPSPTQEGLIESYTSFYFATKGNTYAKIVAKYGTFDFDDFYKWNPAVEEDCSGL
ncbi:hypothetical protein NW759_016647 [Fusarium solani]|nr:hypothetical protein NW759_016647 [Fusarium solani]